MTPPASPLTPSPESAHRKGRHNGARWTVGGVVAVLALIVAVIQLFDPFGPHPSTANQVTPTGSTAVTPTTPQSTADPTVTDFGPGVSWQGQVEIKRDYGADLDSTPPLIWGPLKDEHVLGQPSGTDSDWVEAPTCCDTQFDLYYYGHFQAPSLITAGENPDNAYFPGPDLAYWATGSEPTATQCRDYILNHPEGLGTSWFTRNGDVFCLRTSGAAERDGYLALVRVIVADGDKIVLQVTRWNLPPCSDLSPCPTRSSAS